MDLQDEKATEPKYFLHISPLKTKANKMAQQTEGQDS